MSGEKDEKSGTEEKIRGSEAKADREREIVEERVYTVPLSRAWIMPVTKRAPRAIRILKAFIKKHMKIEEDSIVISNEVNERIWNRGIEKPPRKIRIRASKDKDGIVTVYLAEAEGD
ncbi:MAG: 50S ribosomal protein L31e [Candidatus Bathyarchaeia archaeon]|nr:50S ribosomal protein L31e [Candidatus Bathyarchaeota archaeon]